MRFYHGSIRALPVGTVLEPRGAAYEEEWGNSDFYAALESLRPATARAHKDSVFLVGSEEDIDLAGGATDWLFEVEPVGPVTRHDLNWSSEISCLVGDGHGLDSEQLRQAANAYWSGIPHPNESVWEYLCEKARIIRCEPLDTFDAETPSFPG